MTVLLALLLELRSIYKQLALQRLARQPVILGTHLTDPPLRCAHPVCPLVTLVKTSVHQETPQCALPAILLQTIKQELPVLQLVPQVIMIQDL